ncbi:hypothetical protein [Actinomadura opuntiae]|uniref:hypothetical protein n=1 Tax=Actinomadura sp. OS1-43 TaxID=604315 RepID=UPI00255B1FDE|nr:hypothetical protein [Actinomadura sp. OS1-43]MDL4813166.1 hypothetical protein [Actinomadura sp. OS1-43]
MWVLDLCGLDPYEPLLQAGFGALAAGVITYLLRAIYLLVAPERVPHTDAEGSHREFCGQYLTDADFDATSRALLVRAQTAIDTIRSSRVQQLGLLDEMRTEVVLPAQEWQIAQALHTQTRLRAEQQDAARHDGPDMDAVLAPPNGGHCNCRSTGSPPGSGPWRPMPSRHGSPTKRTPAGRPSTASPNATRPTSTCWPPP